MPGQRLVDRSDDGFHLGDDEADVGANALAIAEGYRQGAVPLHLHVSLWTGAEDLGDGTTGVSRSETPAHHFCVIYRASPSVVIPLDGHSRRDAAHTHLPLCTCKHPHGVKRPVLVGIVEVSEVGEGYTTWVSSEARLRPLDDCDEVGGDPRQLVGALRVPLRGVVHDREVDLPGPLVGEIATAGKEYLPSGQVQGTASVVECVPSDEWHPSKDAPCRDCDQAIPAWLQAGLHGHRVRTMLSRVGATTGEAVSVISGTKQLRTSADQTRMQRIPF
jgi:hypothetical protein